MGGRASVGTAHHFWIVWRDGLFGRQTVRVAYGMWHPSFLQQECHKTTGPNHWVQRQNPSKIDG
ncbi:hypothetical protein CHT98_16600 (plasmid) [Azospirillum brasilense]|uniref:Uncharacterized protein n=1 Tax=Azospirillum brasilense TaxID=192 RepID=A0A235HBN7_AZOBR|nr:hypothetical protein CHT98_16600 [Azospirillum brasilense]